MTCWLRLLLNQLRSDKSMASSWTITSPRRSSANCDGRQAMFSCGFRPQRYHLTCNIKRRKRRWRNWRDREMRMLDQRKEQRELGDRSRHADRKTLGRTLFRTRVPITGHIRRTRYRQVAISNKIRVTMFDVTNVALCAWLDDGRSEIVLLKDSPKYYSFGLANLPLLRQEHGKQTQW